MNSAKKDQLDRDNYFPIVSDLKHSKIYGNYIEINILLTNEKVCSYNCKYCNLGETNTKINNIKNLTFTPSLLITNSINDKYNEIVLANKSVDTILVSGNGEASLHPNFYEISKALSQWKKSSASDSNLTLLTNGAHFFTKRSIQSTQFYDDIFFKVDCSDDITLKKINAPIVRQSLEKLIYSAQKIPQLSVQTMFVSGNIDNTSDEHFEDLIEILGMLKPKKIILSTIKNPINGLVPTQDIVIYNIAQKMRKRISCQIFIDI